MIFQRFVSDFAGLSQTLQTSETFRDFLKLFMTFSEPDPDPEPETETQSELKPENVRKSLWKVCEGFWKKSLKSHKFPKILRSVNSPLERTCPHSGALQN